MLYVITYMAIIKKLYGPYTKKKLYGHFSAPTNNGSIVTVASMHVIHHHHVRGAC